jgi:hypothetical protein
MLDATFAKSLAISDHLELQAPPDAILQCLDALVVHVPWDASVTAPDFPVGPLLVEMYPTNGTNVLIDMEITMSFTDLVFAGTGAIQIWDCGPDGSCGEDVDTRDDTVLTIFATDAMVTINRHFVTVKPNVTLSPFRKHQLAVQSGFLTDLHGVPYVGFSKDVFNFTTWMGNLPSYGWRLTGSGNPKTLGGAWHVCELTFYMSANCNNTAGGEIVMGAPTSSSDVPSSIPSWIPGQPYIHNASVAFDGDLASCWVHADPRPGSWVGLALLKPSYVRSLQVFAKDTDQYGAPEEINVQMYNAGRWYTIHTFMYTETCVNLPTNYQPAVGAGIDTGTPLLIDTLPKNYTNVCSPLQKLALFFSEDIKLIDFGNVPGAPTITLTDSGTDWICGNADDRVTYTIPAFEQNASFPAAEVINNTLYIQIPDEPDLNSADPTGQYKYYCLGIGYGLVTDLAGNPYRGLRKEFQEYKIIVARDPDGEDPDWDILNPVLLNTLPPNNSCIYADRSGLRFELVFSEHVQLIEPPHLPAENATFIPDDGGENISVMLVTMIFNQTWEISNPVITLEVNNGSFVAGKRYSLYLPSNRIFDYSKQPNFDPAHRGEYEHLPFLGTNGAFSWCVLDDIHKQRENYGQRSAVPAFHEEREFLERRSAFNVATVGLPAQAVTLNETDSGDVAVEAVQSRGWPEGAPGRNYTVRETGNGAWPGYGPSDLMLGEPVTARGRRVHGHRHWLRARTSQVGVASLVTEVEVTFAVMPVNSPAQVSVQNLLLDATAGKATYLSGISLEDDDMEILKVEIRTDPGCEIKVLTSAWWYVGNRTHPTTVYKDYGINKHTEEVLPNFGETQGNQHFESGSGRTVSVLSFQGYGWQVRAALTNLTLKADPFFQGYVLVDVLVKDGRFTSEGHVVVSVQAPAAQALTIVMAEEHCNRAYGEDTCNSDPRCHFSNRTILRSQSGFSNKSNQTSANTSVVVGECHAAPSTPSQVGRLLLLATSGCDWRVEDGGSVEGEDIRYSAQISTTDQGDCGEIAFDAASISPDRVGTTSMPVFAGPAMRLPTVGVPFDIAPSERTSTRAVQGSAIWINASSLHVLNHHLAALRWRPCSCPNGFPLCNQTVSLNIERRRPSSAIGQSDVAEATTVCTAEVVEALEVWAAIKGTALKVERGEALNLSDRFHLRGRSPGRRLQITLKAQHGSIYSGAVADPGTKNSVTGSRPCHRTAENGGPACGNSSFVLDTTSLLEAREAIRIAQLRYAPPISWVGTDFLELSFHAILPARWTHMFNKSGTPLTLRKHFRFEVFVDQPVEAKLVLSFSDGTSDRLVEGRPARVMLSLVNLSNDTMAQVRIFTPFGNLSFPSLNTVMDETSGGVIEFFNHHEAQIIVDPDSDRKPWSEGGAAAYGLGNGPSGAKPGSGGTSSTFSFVGSVQALRRALAAFDFVPPYAALGSGLIQAELSPPPTETMSSVTGVKAELLFTVTPPDPAPFPCILGGPAAMLITADQEGAFTQDLNLFATLNAPPAGATADELKASNYSFRVSVEKGELFVRGVSATSIGAIDAPVVQVCPPLIYYNTRPDQVPSVLTCQDNEVSALVIQGPVAKATATLSAIRYKPPLGYVGQDFLRVSADCAAAKHVMGLMVTRTPRPPTIRCANNTIEVRRGTADFIIPPCNISDDFGQPPAVIGIRATTSLGVLALWSDSGLYFDRTVAVHPLLHNVSSQVQFAGNFEQVQYAFTNKLIVLHVPESEPITQGSLVIEAIDYNLNLASTWTGTLVVGSAALPLLKLVIPSPNSTHLVGGLTPLDVSVPSMSVVSDAPLAPCIVKLSVSKGELFPAVSKLAAAEVEWVRTSNRTYKLLARNASAASVVMASLRYKAFQEDLIRTPIRVELLIEAYATPNASSLSIANAALRDERVVYLELYPQVGIPGLYTGANSLKVQRAQRISLRTLGLRFTSGRAITVRLQCDACVMAIDVHEFGSVHTVSGPATALTEHVGGLTLRVSCASCTADTLRIRVWEEGDGDEGDESAYKEVAIAIVVFTSARAQGPPALSVLSQGFSTYAGLPLDLVGVVSLRSADADEPLGLLAVDGALEAVVTCTQGEVTIDTADIVGVMDPPVPTSLCNPFGIVNDSSPSCVIAGSHDEAHLENATGDAANITENISAPWQVRPAPGAPYTVTRRGRSLRLRGRAADLSAALGTLSYTPSEASGRVEIVEVNIGSARDSVPIYVHRQPSAILVSMPALLTTTAGVELRPNISVDIADGSHPTDGFDILVSCQHCSLALWSIEAAREWFSRSLSFTSILADVKTFLANLSYISDLDFFGIDRLVISVSQLRLHAVGLVPPPVERTSAVHVRPSLTRAPPVLLSLPSRFVAREDKATDPQITLRGTTSITPSGVAVKNYTGVTGGGCLRSAGADAFLFDDVSPAPCDLFTPVTNSALGEECVNCVLRLAAVPDRCLAWEPAEGMTAAAYNHKGGGWMLLGCATSKGAAFMHQAFNSSNDRTLFCIAAGPCVSVVGMAVTTGFFRGVPTAMYGSHVPDNCSGVDEAPTPALVPTGITACNGHLRCEHVVDVRALSDPAPGCDKELYYRFTCPNGEDMDFTSHVPFWQADAVTVTLQCPVTLLPSLEPVSLHGALPYGTLEVDAFRTMKFAGYLLDCPRASTDAFKFDNAAPVLVESLPGNGSVAVGMMPQIKLKFSEPIRVAKSTAILREVAVLHRPPSTRTAKPILAVPLAAMLGDAGQMILAVGYPASALAPLTTYELVVEMGSVVDAAGNPFVGIASGAQLFTTGLGYLRPEGWRVVPEEPPANPSARGWQIAELELFTEVDCLGDRLFGTPSSSRALLGYPPQQRYPVGNASGNDTSTRSEAMAQDLFHLDDSNTGNASIVNGTGNVSGMWAESDIFARSPSLPSVLAATLAFDGNPRTWWIGVPEPIRLGLGAAAPAPLSDGTHAWLGLYAEAQPPVNQSIQGHAAAIVPDTFVGDQPTKGSVQNGTHVRSLRLLAPAAEWGGEGARPSAFSVQFFLDGPPRWYALQTVPIFYGSENVCLTLPDDID